MRMEKLSDHNMDDEFKKDVQELIRRINGQLNACRCDGYLGPCGCTDHIRWAVDEFEEKHFPPS